MASAHAQMRSEMMQSAAVYPKRKKKKSHEKIHFLFEKKRKQKLNKEKKQTLKMRIKSISCLGSSFKLSISFFYWAQLGTRSVLLVVVVVVVCMGVCLLVKTPFCREPVNLISLPHLSWECILSTSPAPNAPFNLLVQTRAGFNLQLLEVEK